MPDKGGPLGLGILDAFEGDIILSVTTETKQGLDRSEARLFAEDWALDAKAPWSVDEVVVMPDRIGGFLIKFRSSGTPVDLDEVVQLRDMVGRKFALGGAILLTD